MQPTRLYQIFSDVDFMKMYNEANGNKSISTPKYSDQQYAHIEHGDGVRRSYVQLSTGSWEFYGCN